MDLKRRHGRSSLMVTVLCVAISFAIFSGSLFIGSNIAGFYLSEIDAAESRSFFLEWQLQEMGYDFLDADEIQRTLEINLIVLGFATIYAVWVVCNPIRKLLLFFLRRPVLNVMWLRKFNSDPQRSRFWVSDAIENTGLEYYRTITLGDQQFHFASSNFSYGQNKRVLGVLSFAAISVAFTVLSVYIMHINAIWGIIAVATQGFMIILLFIFARRELQREKVIRERANNTDIEPMSKKEITNHFESAKSYDRVLVYRARDDEWKEVVKSFIIRSDIILIDISNLSDNMRWELEQVVSLKGLGRVILLSDTSFGSKEALIDFVPDFAKKLLDVDDKYLHVMVYSTSGYRAEARAKRFSKAMSQVIYRLARDTPSSQETPAL